MKHARFYTALPRVGRVRSNSASRALYTNPTTLPLGSFFDTPPPPPPNTRLTTHRLPIEARGEVEGPNHANGNANPHAPLALAAPHPPANQHPHPAQLALLFPYTPGPAPKHGVAPATGGTRAQRRRGPRYTLDVGAYGIPKRGHRVRALHTHAEATDAPLAVQVGEDAYFIRENAMGVADGVGGWARVKHPAPPTGPSASALFARRLMHFCADEVDRASHLPAQVASTSRQQQQQQPVVTPWRPPSRFAPYPPSASASSPPSSYVGPASLPSTSAFAFPSSSSSTAAYEPWQTDSPYASYAGAGSASASYAGSSRATFHAPPPPSSSSSSYADFSPWSEPSSSFSSPYAEYDQEYDFDYSPPAPADLLAAELDELAEGLDVLMILERAYERTLGAHVVPASSNSQEGVAPIPIPTPTTTKHPTPPPAPGMWPFALPTPTKTKAQTQTEREKEKTIPLLAGSSTALVAVLDYVPAGEVVGFALDGASGATTSSSTTQTSSAQAASGGANSNPQTKTRTNPHPKHTTTKADSGREQDLTPVLKIAHVGDCMGMLVRGGAVAWRSEEMWWRWNTPVQLSAVGARDSSTQTAATPAGGSTSTKVGAVVSAGRAGWWGSTSSNASTSTNARTATSASSATTSTSTSTHAEITPSSAAHLFTLPVQAGDIVILASDGLSDNLWDEDVLEEVGRVGRAWAAASSSNVEGLNSNSGAGAGLREDGNERDEGVFEISELEEGSTSTSTSTSKTATEAVDGARLRRRTLAGMLSEALCSRARRVATRRAGREKGRSCAVSVSPASSSVSSSTSASSSVVGSSSLPAPRTSAAEGAAASAMASGSLPLRAEEAEDEDETPFARRARETGRVYRGGKNDDISVIVAVIAPAEEQRGRGRGRGRVEAARAAGS